MSKTSTTVTTRSQAKDAKENPSAIQKIHLQGTSKNTTIWFYFLDVESLPNPFEKASLDSSVPGKSKIYLSQHNSKMMKLHSSLTQVPSLSRTSKTKTSNKNFLHRIKTRKQRSQPSKPRLHLKKRRRASKYHKYPVKPDSVRTK